MPISTYHTKHRSSDRESGIRNIRVISHSQESKQSSIILKPAYLDINILKPANLDINILKPAYLDVNILKPAYLDIKILKPAYLDINILKPAYLDINILKSAYLDITKLVEPFSVGEREGTQHHFFVPPQMT